MRAITIGILLVPLATMAQAQTDGTVASQETIRPFVGEQVRIVDANGVERRGTLRALQSGKVRLFTVANGDVRYSLDDITRLDRRGDSLANGCVIGALWPVVSLALGGAQGLDSTEGLIYQVPLAMAMGGLIGVGIDALHVGWTTVYRKDRARRSAFVIAPARRGVHVALVKRF